MCVCCHLQTVPLHDDPLGWLEHLCDLLQGNPTAEVFPEETLTAPAIQSQQG